MPKGSRTIAVFDFDNTLIRGDSLWPFLTALAGWPRSCFAMVETIATFIRRYMKDKNDPELKDPRTFIKARLLKHLLTGYWVGNLTPIFEKLQRWQKWNEPVRQALLDHQAQGHHIVIASGSLDLYLPWLLQDLPHQAVICTRMEIKEGFISGKMVTENCVRAGKAEMVADYIAEQGPFEDSWGYGNFPHDLPMLNLLKQRILV